MSLKKAYQYLFYKIYRFSEKAPTPWWSEWKAVSIINIFYAFIILSSFAYYRVLIDRYIQISDVEGWLISIFLLISILNIYILLYKYDWKEAIRSFDRLPIKQNKKGSWLVCIILSLIFINFIFSFYLFSQVDWSQYR